MKAVFRSKTYRQPEAGRLRHIPPQFMPQRRTGSSLGRSAVQPPDENGLIPRERIQAYCDAIAREFRPRKIVLFSSYAQDMFIALLMIEGQVMFPLPGARLSSLKSSSSQPKTVESAGHLYSLQYPGHVFQYPGLTRF